MPFQNESTLSLMSCCVLGSAMPGCRDVQWQIESGEEKCNATTVSSGALPEALKVRAPS